MIELLVEFLVCLPAMKGASAISLVLARLTAAVFGILWYYG